MSLRDIHRQHGLVTKLYQREEPAVAAGCRLWDVRGKVNQQFVNIHKVGMHFKLSVGLDRYGHLL